MPRKQKEKTMFEVIQEYGKRQDVIFLECQKEKEKLEKYLISEGFVQKPNDQKGVFKCCLEKSEKWIDNAWVIKVTIEDKDVTRKKNIYVSIETNFGLATRYNFTSDEERVVIGDISFEQIKEKLEKLKKELKTL